MYNWKVINQEIKSCIQLETSFDKIICLENLIEKYGKDGMIYFKLGEVYEEIGDLGKALEMFENAYTLFPFDRYKRLAMDRINAIKSKLNVSMLSDTSMLDEGKDALYIVNCTKIKIWDLDPAAPPFVPAILAYRGHSFKKFLEFVESKNIKWWLILSAKYGFIEPWHPIENYNVSFSEPSTGSITDDALRNQVLYQTRWNYTGNPRRLRDFKTVYVYRDPTYYEKTKKAFEGLAKVIYLDKLD